MTHLDIPSVPPMIASSDDLRSKLRSAPEKVQLQLIDELVAAGASGLEVLMEFLAEHRVLDLDTAPKMPSLVVAKAYQQLFHLATPQTLDFLKTHFPVGVVPLKTQHGIDYHPLQELLAQQDFQAADKLTLQKLCELAGTATVLRNWVYFTEVATLPVTDLQTLDALWLAHSEGKFGFSVQREIWLSGGKNWDKLWPKIGWKVGNNWTRYPHEFTWSLEAPRGHLPLSNQLRGVRAFAALLAHPAWTMGYGSEGVRE
jgi:GUN4-like/ARM-like repeat domain, GUN4-N terminal